MISPVRDQDLADRRYAAREVFLNAERKMRKRLGSAPDSSGPPPKVDLSSLRLLKKSLSYRSRMNTPTKATQKQIDNPTVSAKRMISAKGVRRHTPTVLMMDAAPDVAAEGGESEQMKRSRKRSPTQNSKRLTRRRNSMPSLRNASESSSISPRHRFVKRDHGGDYHATRENNLKKFERKLK